MKYELNASDSFHGILEKENSKNRIVLIDLWSKRCEYCRISAPAVDYIHSIFTEKVTLLKVEIEKFPYIADEYKVSVLPMQILIFKNKKIKEYLGVDTLEKTISEIESDIKSIITE